jgi:toxin HigB-1
VIRSFADKETEKVFRGEHSFKLPVEIQERTQLRLERIHFATVLSDLRQPPSHNLEALK